MRFSEFKEANTFGTLLKQLIGSEPSGLSGFGSMSADTDAATGASGSGSKADVKDIQDPDFEKKLVKVANALGIDPANLKKIIRFETAGSFSPSSHDPWNVSVGLIGFTEQTAHALGTSKAELSKMTAVQQLDYVYRFYKMNGLKPGSDVGTMYMLTFMPAYAYSPDSMVLGKKNGGTLGKSGLSMHKVWLQNPGFGKSKGKDFFTVGDVKNTINSR